MTKLVFSKNSFFLIFVAVVFSACISKSSIYRGETIYNKPQYTQQKYIKMAQRPIFFNDLNGAINELANQILINNVVLQESRKIVLTTLVSLEKFKDTSTFGRVTSESLIDELHVRNFRIIDFRGQDNISVNEKGEFHITRDTQKLRKELNQVLILVGTYSKFDHGSMVINLRLLNFDTGDVLSTGRVIYNYKDCSLFNICEDSTKMKIIEG